MVRSAFILFATTVATFAVVCASPANGADISFNRDVLPILSDNCFKCHGPDQDQRQADLRLDTKEGVFGDDSNPIVVPGETAASEIYRRIVSNDADERMPPPDSNLSLTKQQVAVIAAWIDQGATWEQHWAFVAPQREAVPEALDRERERSPIDRFVAQRLITERVSPSQEATREELIRRVALDLTGLPPTNEDVATFLADPSPNAYERLVDRLLASPAYGERMAMVWLDAARYADTSGYQNDGPREMWRWRDWVIDAYNAGMPFDQFTREQLAGDLLPNATLDQRIATGFNRNHRGNAEGGVIPEEFQVEYVVDRVETTSTVWLGLTLGCTRCHEHKYDPFSQREFYQLFAYFNNVPENGRAVKEGNSPPYIKAPTAEQQRQLKQLDQAIRTTNLILDNLEPEYRARQRAWELKAHSKSVSTNWSIDRGQVARFAFDEATDVPGAAVADGVAGKAVELDGSSFVDAGDVANFGYFDSFSVSAWIRPTKTNAGTIVSRMTDAEQADGYYVQLADGHVQVNLVKRWLDDSVRVETETTVQPNEWTHVVVTYDGSRVASGINVFLNGDRVPLKVNYDFINQTFASTEPLRIGGGGGEAGRFRGQIDEVRIYDRAIDSSEARILSVSQSVTELLKINGRERSERQQQKLDAYYLAEVAQGSLKHHSDHLLDLKQQRAKLVKSFPTVMVMEEGPKRETFVLARGEYDKPTDRVSASVPSILAVGDDSPRPSRVELADWLTSESNPLTARVAVNRYWQMLFGIGLVKTSEDFGTQGERPTHPSLMDWLAVNFKQDGWDVKSTLRSIVTSATYRRSSRTKSDLIARDPENRLLARGPRYRLRAETVRDQALAAAGLLTHQVGGPSVKPYQPEGLWKDIATDSDYEQSHGADLYRRSLYTYWKRTVVPPAMSAFDGAAREMCQVRPRRTNTPLQALTLMNDITFVEASRALADRAVTSTLQEDDRIRFIFQSLLARQPKVREVEVLRDGLRAHISRFHESPDEAVALNQVGEYVARSNADPIELAAYTMLASLVLNLDETVTKQ